MNYFVKINFLGLLLIQGILGQTDSSKKSDTGGRRAWVVSTTIPKDMSNPFNILVGEKLHLVRMHLRAVGKSIPIDKAGIVRVVKPVKDTDGKVSYENLSLSKVPEGVREALIVLVPTEEEGEPLRFRSKVIDLKKFKKGGCLYVNLVNTKLGVTIGEHKTVIPPGEMEFINPLKSKDKDVLPVRFFYEIPNEVEDKWKLMTSSKMAIYSSRREICIFFYNKQIENVDFRGIPFMTPRPAPRSRKP